MQPSNSSEAPSPLTAQTFSFTRIGQPLLLLSRITAQNGATTDQAEEEDSQPERSSPRMVDTNRTNPLGSLALGLERESLSPEVDYTVGWDPQLSTIPPPMDTTNSPQETSQLGYSPNGDSFMGDADFFASHEDLQNPQYESFLSEFMARSNASIASLDGLQSSPTSATPLPLFTPSSPVSPHPPGLAAAKKLVSETHSKATNATEHITASLSLAEKTVSSAQEALGAFRHLGSALEMVVQGYGDVMETLAKEDAKARERTRTNSLSRQKERQGLADLQEWVGGQIRDFQDKHFALASENAFLRQEVSKLLKEKTDADLKHRWEVSRLKTELATLKKKGGFAEDDRRKETGDGEGRRPSEGPQSRRTSGGKGTASSGQESSRNQVEALAQREAQRSAELEAYQQRRAAEAETLRLKQQMEEQARRREEVQRQKVVAQQEEAVRIHAQRSGASASASNFERPSPSPVIKREPSPITVWSPQMQSASAPLSFPTEATSLATNPIPPSISTARDGLLKDSGLTRSMSMSRSSSSSIPPDHVADQRPISPAAFINQPSTSRLAFSIPSNWPAIPVAWPAASDSFVPSSSLRDPSAPTRSLQEGGTYSTFHDEHNGTSARQGSNPSATVHSRHPTSSSAMLVDNTSRSSRGGTPILLPPLSPNNSDSGGGSRTSAASPAVSSNMDFGRPAAPSGQAMGPNVHDDTMNRVPPRAHSRNLGPPHSSLPVKPANPLQRPPSEQSLHGVSTSTGRTHQRDSRDGVDGRPTEGRRSSLYRPASPTELRHEDRSYRPPLYSAPTPMEQGESSFVRGRRTPPPRSAPLPSDMRPRDPTRRATDSYVPSPGYDQYIPSSPRSRSPPSPHIRNKRSAPSDDIDVRATRPRYDSYRPAPQDRSPSPPRYYSPPVETRWGADSSRAPGNTITNNYRPPAQAPQQQNHPQADVARVNKPPPNRPRQCSSSTKPAGGNPGPQGRNASRPGPSREHEREHGRPMGNSFCPVQSAPNGDRSLLMSNDSHSLLDRINTSESPPKKGKGNAQRGSGGRGGALSGRTHLGRPNNNNHSNKPSLTDRIAAPSLQNRLSDPRT